MCGGEIRRKKGQVIFPASLVTVSLGRFVRAIAYMIMSKSYLFYMSKVFTYIYNGLSQKCGFRETQNHTFANKNFHIKRNLIFVYKERKLDKN